MASNQEERRYSYKGNLVTWCAVFSSLKIFLPVSCMFNVTLTSDETDKRSKHVQKMPFVRCFENRLRLYLSVMTCPLAQKQARHTLLDTDTTSARSTKDDSVMLWTNRQDCEGIKNTLACLSEHTTARCPSPQVSWEDDGEKWTSLRFRGLSGSSGALGSRQTS